MTKAPPPRAWPWPLALIALGLALWSSVTPAADIDVEVEGLSGKLADNVRAYLSIIRFREIVDLSATNIRSMHSRAEREIRQALQPFGYYDPTVEASLDETEGRWLANYRIDPGEPVRFGAVRLEVTGPGSEDPAFVAILNEPGVATGEVALHAKYEQLKRRFRQSAYNNGYRDADLIEHQLLIDPQTRTAEIRLVMETGQRYTFGKVTYDQDILDDALMVRYPRFEEGDPFSARTLLDLEYALSDSAYFSVVEITTGDATDLSVPVRVKAEPGKRHKYGAGVGFGTDTGPRVSLGWQNRRINRAGHRLALDTKLSSTKQDISGRYIIPLEDPVRERLTIRAAATAEELGDTDSRKNELTVTETRQLGEWQRETYVRLLDETTTVDDVDTDSTLLIPGLAYRRVRKDDPVFPRRGSLLEGDIHGTHESLGSGTSFLQLRIDTRILRPAGPNHRLILRGSFGLSTVAEFAELPASERFFAGGDQSVRGFGLNELGPKDDAGQVVGGKHLMTGSVEFEWRINDRWALAVFADAGNALDSFSDSLEAAVGIGVRRNTQVGQIRFDLAQALTESGENPRIHFSFGPEL